MKKTIKFLFIIAIVVGISYIVAYFTFKQSKAVITGIAYGKEVKDIAELEKAVDKLKCVSYMPGFKSKAKYIFGAYIMVGVGDMDNEMDKLNYHIREAAANNLEKDYFNSSISGRDSVVSKVVRDLWKDKAGKISYPQFYSITNRNKKLQERILSDCRAYRNFKEFLTYSKFGSLISKGDKKQIIQALLKYELVCNCSE